MLEMNRLAMHVPLSGFRRQELDGLWSLELFETPDEVLAGALTGVRPNAVQVAVPGNWTMQDLSNANGEVFVDKPHYTNVQMPFDGPPPRLPDRNPAGVYRRTVTVPADWHDDRTVLHVAGAESVHAVYGRRPVRGIRHRQPPAQRVRDRPTADPGGQRAGHRGRSVQRPQLHRGPGPVVDGRPAPLGVDRVAPQRPYRRHPCGDRLRSGHGRGDDRGNGRGRLRRRPGAGLVDAVRAPRPHRPAVRTGRRDAGARSPRPEGRQIRGGCAMGPRPSRGVERRGAPALHPGRRAGEP